mmetsp:Transcript_1739/g.2973  ORF Transcript_1739/g.2973 Transcript_1739/m.2973 type:complete len:563 (-) Transcript_1739:75-1763(-)
MDFISLASATSSRSLLRQLEAENNDDDFAHLSIAPAESDPSGFASISADGSVSPSEYVSEPNTQKPLLSPSAETELFMLATNFLLYVAMVIITTMVCKIYFPESLERGRTMARSVSYVRVSGEDANDPNTSSSYYSSDAEDEDDVDDESREDEVSMGDEEQECVNEQEEAEELLLEMEPEVTGQPGKKKDRRSRKKENNLSRSSSVGSFLEFDQRTTSKKSVLKRLAFCVVMLNLTFVAWGVLQERMLTRRYPRLTGEYFTYSYALVFTNRCWTVIMSGGLMMYLKPRWSQSTIIYEYSFPSISNMLSSWCQYEALQYVSFPAVTLFKSFKLAPVMAMGKILGNKEYPQYDYAVALVIGVGLTMFMSSTDDLHFGYDIYGEEASATWTGIMLLFFFLFFDSFTSQWQSRMFQRHRDLSMIELMFATSAFSTVLSFITLVHSKELWPALSFVYRHSEIHLHFFMFSICSTIGQLFIFYTIKNFGAVVFTIIMTTRILLSIALSCILYGHEVTSVGFLGLMMVMGAVCYRIKRKAEGKQLIKWQGMGDEKAPELVQEWHEHVDM